ncbi:hypothetical protein NWQ33_03965 [Mycoplasmopsis cynos]|nr:hypothetical protein [Mycoplasmopsis cynos]
MNVKNVPIENAKNEIRNIQPIKKPYPMLFCVSCEINKVSPNISRNFSMWTRYLTSALVHILEILFIFHPGLELLYKSKKL